MGINNFVAVAQDYLTPETVGAWLAPAHNKYLLVWSETGVVGLLGFIWLLLAISRQAWWCYRQGVSEFSALGAALLASLCGYAVHMMGDKFTGRSTVQLLWWIGAIAMSVRKVLHDMEDSPP